MHSPFYPASVVLLQLHGSMVSHMQVLPTPSSHVNNTKYLYPYNRNHISCSCLFLSFKQLCRDVESGADRHLDITFGLQVVEGSSLVSVLFREVLSHPYISFFHLLVNCFSITCLPSFFYPNDKYRFCCLTYNFALPQCLHNT